MSDIEMAVKGSRLIESLLEEKLGASGKGLHTKLSSVEKKLSAPMISKIRYIASVRNSVVHEEGCLLYTSPSPRDATLSRMPSSA